jgi:hypothetical protein
LPDGLTASLYDEPGNNGTISIQSERDEKEKQTEE